MAKLIAVPAARPATAKRAEPEVKSRLPPRLAAAGCTGIGAEPVGVEIGKVIGRRVAPHPTKRPRHRPHYRRPAPPDRAAHHRH